MFPAAPYIFGVGVIGILYTMLGWWTDVAREATHEGLPHPGRPDLSSLWDDPIIASKSCSSSRGFGPTLTGALFPADMHQITREQLFGGVWPPHGNRDLRSLATFRC